MGVCWKQEDWGEGEDDMEGGEVGEVGEGGRRGQKRGGGSIW